MPANEPCREDVPDLGKPRSPIARRRFGGLVRPEGLRRVVYVMTEADREKGELVERIYNLIEKWRA
jgi:hypothetical protein